MAMNDERRRVAAELMELSKLVFAPENTYELLADALGVDDFDGTDELFARLADLIDPDESGQDQDTVPMESGASGNPACDRDALLALARGLEKGADEIIRAAKNAQFYGGGPRMGEAHYEASEWRSIARYIRRACGEVV